MRSVTVARTNAERGGRDVIPRIPSVPEAFPPGIQKRGPGEEMTEMVVDLPEELAEAIEQRATALGTTADHWLSMVIADVVADVPEEGDGPDDWICR